MRIPIYVDGSIPIKDLADAIAPLGYHLRFDAGHRLVIDPVPHGLRRGGAKTEPNVVAITTASAKRRK